MKKLLIIATAISLSACGFLNKNVEYRCTGNETRQHMDAYGNPRYAKDVEHTVVKVYVSDVLEEISFDNDRFKVTKPSKQDYFVQNGTYQHENKTSSGLQEYKYWFDPIKKTLNYKKVFMHEPHKNPANGFMLERVFSGTCSIVK